MSKLEQLIQELCPDGVEYKTLNDISTQMKGMSGVANKWSESGNCQFIDYMNVYRHLKVDVNNLPYATVKSFNQQILKQGDILFTSASETQDECAISSVIEDTIIDGIFLDDHLFGIRIKENCINKINATYLNYYFHSPEFRLSVNKTVRGVTRFYISKVDFMKLSVPIPPLEVQNEIVRILDNFTELTAELTAELTIRKKQYEYYRDNSIKTCNAPHYYHLCDIAEIYDGTHCTPEYVEKGIPFISVENINNIYGSNKYITEDAFNKYKIKPRINDVFMTRIGSIGTCAVFDKQEDLAYYVSLALIRPNTKIVLSKYLKHTIESFVGRRELRKRTLVNAVPIKINKGDIGKLYLPIPSLEEQQRIVDILDRLDKLCNDISQGLPAEIEARKKQYEFYRDKLLTFKRLRAEAEDICESKCRNAV